MCVLVHCGCAQELKGKDPMETLTWHTPEGIPVKPIYTRDDVDVRCRTCSAAAIGVA